MRENLYAFSDFWRKVKMRAEQILNRNPGTTQVDICAAKGEVIRTVTREVWVKEPWPDKSEDRSRERTEPARETKPPAIASKMSPGKQRAKSTPLSPKSKKRGRPPGKRSNPGYTQITAYVRTRTINDVKVELIKQGSKQDASELIEELLSAWLQKD
ncbi:MAG: hypothetical protein HONDAALG_00471 [Gammaproteobacteria bacterium]|nr:hypothetical protein [Gammaproteobacteria bacterium]